MEEQKSREFGDFFLGVTREGVSFLVSRWGIKENKSLIYLNSGTWTIGWDPGWLTLTEVHVRKPLKNDSWKTDLYFWDSKCSGVQVVQLAR